MLGVADLCSFCRRRLAPFVLAHPGHPRMSETEVARLIDSFARSCCARWRGREPAHWFSRPEHAPENGSPVDRP